jgi:hypothetical protein
MPEPAANVRQRPAALGAEADTTIGVPAGRSVTLAIKARLLRPKRGSSMRTAPGGLTASQLLRHLSGLLKPAS